MAENTAETAGPSSTEPTTDSETMGEERTAKDEAILWLKEFNQQQQTKNATTSKTFVMIPKQQNDPFFDFLKKGCEDQAAALTKELKETTIECHCMGQ
jgi:ABC-type sugar transport system substrate-binding protein